MIILFTKHANYHNHNVSQTSRCPCAQSPKQQTSHTFTPVCHRLTNSPPPRSAVSPPPLLPLTPGPARPGVSPSSSEPVRFPVKLTDPPTAVLYITPDWQHLQELKHTIHVKEVNLGELLFGAAGPRWEGGQ